MSQTVVNDEPGEAYEGKVQYGGQLPTTIISRLGSELIYFGKGVSLLSDADLTVGDQSVKLPALADDVTALFEGVAIADPSQPRMSLAGVPAPYGAYPDEAAVSVMRKGLIWVVVDVAIADIKQPVYLRWDNAGTAPADALGSFETATDANNQVVPAAVAQWRGAVAVGGIDFGLLELNL
jgi:hypothetical protein